MTIKVILDANVIISYLLTFRSSNTIPIVVEWCIRQPRCLIMPVELIQEVTDVIARKPYLRARIPLAELDMMLKRLLAVAEIPVPLEETGSYSVDAKDDYLIAHGLIQHANYLITGDAGLLALQRVHTLHIVDPLQFFILLQQQGLLKG